MASKNRSKGPERAFVDAAHDVPKLQKRVLRFAHELVFPAYDPKKRKKLSIWQLMRELWAPIQAWVRTLHWAPQVLLYLVFACLGAGLIIGLFALWVCDTCIRAGWYGLQSVLDSKRNPLKLRG